VTLIMDDSAVNVLTTDQLVSLGSIFPVL